jgi:hypothetical protein
MLAAGTFELIDVIEIAIMLAIPAILIFLLVRSFRQPKAQTRVEADAHSANE